MLRKTVLALGLLLAGGAWAHGADKAPAADRAEGRLYPTDEVVLNRLHAINQEEIAAGQLGQQKGSSQGVKDYAARLIQDHQQNDQELAALAQQKGIALQGANDPALPPHVRHKAHKDMKKMDALQSLSGAEFDRRFLTQMQKGHEHALEFLQRAQAARQGDAALSALIGKTIPVVDQHRQIASDLLSGSNTAATDTALPETRSGAGEDLSK